MKKTLLKKIVFVLTLAVLLQNLSRAQTVSIGPMTGTTTYLYGPYYRFSATAISNYSKYAYLFTAAELNIPVGSVITEVGWYKASGTISGNNVWNIYMENTATTSLPTSSTWGAISATAQSVYSSTTHQYLAPNNSWESTVLTTPFIYTGGSLLVLTDHVKMGTASAPNLFYTLASPGKILGIASSAVLTSSSVLGNTTFGTNRPTIQITYTTPLTIKLVSFTALRKDNDVRLAWTIASEEKIDRYTIERSGNGKDFEGVGSVEANGQERYEFTDKNVTSGTSASRLYYRLKSEGETGSNDYSKVAIVNTGDNGPAISIYPNPFIDVLEISAFATQAGTIDISLKDITGRVVATQINNIAAGNNTIRMGDIQHLPRGNYHLVMNLNGTLLTERLVK